MILKLSFVMTHISNDSKDVGLLMKWQEDEPQLMRDSTSQLDGVNSKSVVGNKFQCKRNDQKCGWQETSNTLSF